MQHVNLTSWSPPSKPISRAALERALPNALKRHVTTETPKKALDALRAKLPSYLDKHLTRSTATARQDGEKWSVISSPASALDRANKHVAAISVRLTKGTGKVGDYARESVPEGEVIINEDGVLLVRGPQWLDAAVTDCESDLKGKITNTELLKVWRAILKDLGGWSWTKLAWYVPEQSTEKLTKVRKVFTNLGADVPVHQLVMGLGGESQAEVVRCLLKNVFEICTVQAQRALQAHDDQDAYLDPANDERKQGIRMGAIVEQNHELEKTEEVLRDMLSIVDESHLYMGVAVKDIHDAVKALSGAQRSILSIDRKEEAVPASVARTAEAVLKMTQADMGDMFDAATAPAPTPETETETETTTTDAPEPTESVVDAGSLLDF